MDQLLRLEATSVGEDVEKGEPSYTADGNESWCILENSVEIP